MGLGERIEERLHAKGWSQAELARRIGVKSTSIWKLVSGQSHGSKHLHAIARELETTPEYLLGETDDVSPASKITDRRLPFKHQPPDDDSLAIPMLELAYGMGGTFLDGVDPGESMERFPRAFVRMFTSAPASQLCFSHGIGDSMEPTIGDRDLLLIDRSRDTIRINDQVWVLAASGIGMVKRVRVEGEGRIMLLSDNQNVPDYQVAEDELTVIGRVIAVVRRI